MYKNYYDESKKDYAKRILKKSRQVNRPVATKQASMKEIPQYSLTSVFVLLFKTAPLSFIIEKGVLILFFLPPRARKSWDKIHRYY